MARSTRDWQNSLAQRTNRTGESSEMASGAAASAGGYGRGGKPGLAGQRRVPDKRDLVVAELAHRLLNLGSEGVLDDGAEVGPRSGRGGDGPRRRAEDPAEPRLVRGVAGSAADQPGGQVRQRAAHQAVVESHVMDETIDRYVGGVKHVTMKIYI